jgi:hypothetical protein
MQELIERVAETLGIDAGQAEKAVGVLLSLVSSHGDDGKVAELFNAMPGAAELAAAHDGASAPAGGLMGMLGGAIGGPLAALSKLQATGLDTGQLKTLGNTVLGYAREQAGEDIVAEVTDSIPGLGAYL